ncbi:MAG TPA: DUF2202 domain-containing protein [Blastocatellia bacterium]|nr:DUF2202 domain-containing protein [Blastocatellia bacterium]
MRPTGFIQCVAAFALMATVVAAAACSASDTSTADTSTVVAPTAATSTPDTLPAGTSTLDQRTAKALVTALNDERRAESSYAAVIRQFGSVRPFSHIVGAERQHQELLLTLFAKYNVAVPADANDQTTPVEYATLRDACSAAVRAEQANAAMYDEFLSYTTEADIRAVFTQLRDNSRNKHLPAFERCSTGAGTGQGRGQGFRN